MKADLRISVKGYHRNKNLKILVVSPAVSMAGVPGADESRRVGTGGWFGRDSGLEPTAGGGAQVAREGAGERSFIRGR